MSSQAVQSIFTYTRTGEAPTQEDAVSANAKRGTFVVADGFGGGKLGFDSATAVCKWVQEFLEREAGDLEATLPFVLKKYYSLAGNVVFNSVLYANDRLLASNREREAEKGGASVVAAFLEGETLALASVGACTALLVRGGKGAALARPRCYQRMINPVRRLDPTENPIPLMAVGMYAELEPEIVETRIQHGDWLILHTGVMPEAIEAWLFDFQQKVNSNSLVEGPWERVLEGKLQEWKNSYNFSVLVSRF